MLVLLDRLVATRFDRDVGAATWHDHTAGGLPGSGVHDWHCNGRCLNELVTTASAQRLRASS